MKQTYLPADTRDRILDLMKEKKLTQAEIAEKIGISESTFSRYLQGKTKKLGDGSIIRMAKVFGVSTDFLLGESDIPDRRNYDIEELGLSAEAARLLYTGKVNAKILNQLIENPHFPQLLQLLGRYQDRTMVTGINALNNYLAFSSSMLLGQSRNHSSDALAARNAAIDVASLRMPPETADTNIIQNCFMTIVRELRQQGVSSAADEQITATSDTLKAFRKNLSKGNASLGLQQVTESDISDAIVQTISGTGLPSETLSELKTVLTKAFTSLKGPES